ncbi:MAG: DUF2142 domain-containing protein [Paludibacteraceae bacterium]|nr:DUF2142 domain-containing protein [Paludibacteraceae bacterium]
MIKAKICDKILIAPEKIFLVIALFFGLAFIIATPPFQTADEPAHFFRAFQLSDFSLIGKKDKTISGGYIPKQLVDMTNNLTRRKSFSALKAIYPIKIGVGTVKQYLLHKSEDKGYTFIDFRNTVIYPPIVYLPQTLGVGLARIFNLPPLWMVYLGRLFNLLVYIAIVFYAIKICPVYKYGFLLFALMPMTMAQVSSLSADACTFSFSFLLIAYILNLAVDLKFAINWKHILYLTLISFFLSLSKYAYILLPALFFIIPKEKFSSSIQRINYFLIIFLVAVAGSILWFVSIKNIYIPFITIANPVKQLHFITLHPFLYMKIMANTCNLAIIHSFIGTLGWLNNPLPLWICICYLVIIIANALFEDDKKHFSRYQLLVVILVVIFSFCLLSSILYLSTSKVGDKYIWGVQGRYFIPFAPLLLLPFANKLPYLKKCKAFYNKYKAYILPVVPVIMLSVSVWVIARRYY